MNKTILLESPIGLEEEAKKVNAIIEIPKGTNEKYEMSTKEPGNIIQQDKKDERQDMCPQFIKMHM